MTVYYSLQALLLELEKIDENHRLRTFFSPDVCSLLGQ
jgi:hypothetical protein